MKILEYYVDWTTAADLQILSNLSFISHSIMYDK